MPDETAYGGRDPVSR